MIRRRLPATLLPALLLAGGFFAPAADAQILAFGDGDRSLALSGYLRALTGVQDLGYEVPGATSVSAFHGEVVRLKWRGQAGRYVLDVHQRIQARLTSAEQDAAVGFGVSVVPARSLDLSTILLDQPGVRLLHDIDRLSVSIRTSGVDVTLGRQPITWGNASIFTVADLWASFSPFELDTEEKPGIDAARALFYPADGVEVDAVVADRGSAEDLSAGVRVTWGLATADVWAGAAKAWNQAMSMAGVTFLLDQSRLRLEAVQPFDLDGGTFLRPGITAGVDWIRGRVSLTAEAHYNGVGAAAPVDYLGQLGNPRFLRGESYFLGRTYVGAAGTWAPDEEGRVRLALSALLNAGDGSAALTPLVDYDLGPATSLALGGLVSFGDTPAPPAGLRSEFGAYGDLVFTRVSVYF